MRFRLGLAIGMGAGYVLGTRAGRERYEQIIAAARDLRASDTARNLESSAREVWETAKEEFPVVGQVSDQVETVLDLGGDTSRTG